MKFEVRHTDTGIEISVVTDSEDGDESTGITLSVTNIGNSPESVEVANLLLRELGETRGIYGHLVDPLATSNADLAIALNFLPSFNLLKSPEIPELTSIPDEAFT